MSDTEQACGAPAPAPEQATPALLVLADAEALRDHLDALNEAGQHPVAVGIDSTPLGGQPFLIALVGPYAEGEAVFFDSPWQSDIGWTEGRAHCDECGGWEHSIEHLRYPVTVLTPGRDST